MTPRKKPARLTSRLLRTLGNNITSRDNEGTRLCIINYHRVLEASDPLLDPEPDVTTFRWQMELLAECFNVIPLSDAVMALGERRIPPRAVCITFDDGYRSTYERAMPILREFDLPATVFVTTGTPDQRNMWNDRILEAIRRLPPGALDLREIGLGVHTLKTLGQRKQALNNLMETSKYLPPLVRRDVVQKLEDLAGGIHPENLMLTTEMIATLPAYGIEIGGHTISHPILTRLDDEAAWQEIAESKRQLEMITGKPITLFAYPNGKAGTDFNERHVQMVKDAGYIAAFTTARGAATEKHDRYQLPRSRPWDSVPLMFGIRLLTWLSKRPI